MTAANKNEKNSKSVYKENRKKDGKSHLINIDECWNSSRDAAVRWLNQQHSLPNFLLEWFIILVLF